MAKRYGSLECDSGSKKDASDSLNLTQMHY